MLVIAFNIFDEFAKKSNFFENGKEARNIYDKYLFHFIELNKIENSLKYSADAEGVQKKLIEFMNYDPSYMIEVPVIDCNTSDKEEINKLVIEGLKNDLVILRGFVDKFDFNPEYFTEKFIVEKYGEQRIEIIEQTPNFFGFTNNLYSKKFNLYI